MQPKCVGKLVGFRLKRVISEENLCPDNRFKIGKELENKKIDTQLDLDHSINSAEIKEKKVDFKSHSDLKSEIDNIPIVLREIAKL